MFFLEYIWLIPLFPACGAAIMFFFGRKLQKTSVSAVCVLAVLCTFVMALGAFLEYPAYAKANPDKLGYETTLYTWLGSDSGLPNYLTLDGRSAAFRADAGFLFDPLSGIWLLFVTGVGTLIHIYSTGYMAHEGGYYRFFGYLNLFMFSMLTLILANNYALMFVGWEGVGLCSFLLIGFYFQRKSAGDAANKAFITNRIGDAGFILGLLTIAWLFGSIQFTKVTEMARSGHFAIGDHWITIATLMLFIGACGKSAQLPLYVVARCHGRPDASLRIDSRGNHGHSRCIHGRPLERVVRPGSNLDAYGCHRGRVDRNIRRFHRVGTKRHQARPRVLNSVSTRLHVPGIGSRRICRWRLPRIHSCFLQGTFVPRRRFSHPRNERRAGHAQHGRLAWSHQDNLSHHGHRHAGHRRDPYFCRIFLQG